MNALFLIITKYECSKCISSSLAKFSHYLESKQFYLSTFLNIFFNRLSNHSLLYLNIIFHHLFNIIFILNVQKKKEMLNILVIKIHLKSNSNSSCVESTVAYLLYFLQFEKVVGANFCGFALQT